MQSLKYLEILNKFTFDLIGIQYPSDLCWYAAQEVVGKLGYADCVVYILDDDHCALVQTAAVGIKNPKGKSILNPLKVPLGKGISGMVAKTREPCIINEASKSKSYIKDINLAGSELCVPIIYEGTLFGVIDSEHENVNYFTEKDLKTFTEIATLMGAKLAQLKLVERDKEHSKILENIHETVVVSSPDGYIKSINEFGERTTGYSLNELRKIKISDLIIHKEGGEKLRKKIVNEMVAHGAWSGRIKFKGKNQDPRWYEVRSTPNIGPSNEFLGSISILRDIDHLVDTENELKRQATVFESVNDAILLFDTNAKIVDCNNRTETMMGLKRDQIIDMTSVEFAADKKEWQQGLRETLTALAETGKFIGTGRAKHSSGKVFPIETSMTLFYNESGIPLGTVAVIRDLTEQRRAENILHQSQKMEAIGQLTSGIAHDFNNILTVVLGNLEMASHLINEDDESSKFLSLAMKGAQKGAALNRKLLSFSKQQLTEETDCNIDSIILGQTTLISSMLGANIKFQTSLKAGERCSRLDPAMLESAILNLAINSKDAMPGGGTLKIKTKIIPGKNYPDIGNQTDPLIQLLISDTGMGMTPEVQSRAIEPFFTTKKLSGGSGLGLSMVFSFVKRIGGLIEIDSEEGKGTNINIYLPSFKSVSETLGNEDAADSLMMANGELILVVEDQIDVMDVMCHYLTSLGYKVITASNGNEAIQQIKDMKEQIHLVLSDIVMPGGIDGIDVVKMATKTDPKIKAILMSGNPELHEKKDEQGLGTFKLLRKPFEKSVLAEAVRRALRTRQ